MNDKDPHQSSNWQHSPLQSQNGFSSPLDALATAGGRSHKVNRSPNPQLSQLATAKAQIYEKAFALSRSTSVRNSLTHVPPKVEDDDDDDDAEDAKDGQRNRSGANLQGLGLDISNQSAPSRISSNPARGGEDHGSGLLRNAFRGSVASDASFNTITGQDDRESIMFGGPSRRRDSIGTVTSAEFGADGKWGRAWTGRADDEESMYDGDSMWSEGTQGGSYDSDRPGGALDALRKLAANGGGLESLSLGQSPAMSMTKAFSPAATTSSKFSVQPSNAAERIVSLTPSYYGLRDRASQASEEDASSATPIAGGEDDARIFVWPPTPAGSEAGHGQLPDIGFTPTDADAASIHEWEAVTDYGSDTASLRGSVQSITSEVSVHQSRSPAIYNSPEVVPQSGPSGPATVASALTGRLARSRQESSDSTRSSQNGTDSRSSSVERKRHGHPAGRPPPAPPSIEGRYEDPNTLYNRNGFGKNRAAAIAAADGRESIISDLDVETLRLDGSSRRDSSSTLGSQATSRMSVGTVHFEPHSASALQSPPLPSDSFSSQQYRSRSGSGSSLNKASPATSTTSPPTSTPRKFQDGSHTSSLQRSAAVNSARLGVTPSMESLNSMRQPGQQYQQQQRQMQSQQSSRPAQSQSHQDQSGYNRSPQTSPSQTQQPFDAHRRPAHAPRTASSSSDRHKVGVDTKTGPSAAEHYLTQGIQYHEQGDMSRSAYYFERSAKVDGGCVVGMCMWGMTLREGWGARKDPRKGFEWIQRAASKAGELMQNSSQRRTEAEVKAIRSELKLSVYELGKCFCYGWGTKMDKKTGLEYFELAAKLGDADAQAEAGALYAAGKGCKKDLKKAAKYYRMAAAQGYDLIGLSWVWKPKFDD